MTSPLTAVTELTEMAQRSQAAATELVQTWTTAARTVGDAAGTQASSLRRLVGGMFDLADQAVSIERELATFLAVNARVSAATLDSFRALAESATGALEDVARTATWAR